jgi:hypothetical protein
VVTYQGETAAPVPEPGVVNGDTLRTRMAHTDYRVTVTIGFADLRRKGSRGEFVRIRTNEGVRRSLSLTAGPGNWAGTALLERADGTDVSCSVGSSIDYAANVVRLQVPRTCLSNPRWVRLGIASYWERGDDNDTLYVDDALVDGPWNGNYVKLSDRKIRRG